MNEGFHKLKRMLATGKEIRFKFSTAAWTMVLLIFIYLVLSFTLYAKHKQTFQASPAFQPVQQLSLKSLYKDLMQLQEGDFQGYADDFINNQVLPPIENEHDSQNIVREAAPVQHIAFLKVHKTASSTAQNIFLRYGDDHNLTFVLPHTKGESGWPNVISYNNSVTKTNIVPAPPGRQFDLLCCHVVYARNAFAAILPEDTAYIGIVREPISRFQSAVKYFSPGYILRLPGKTPLSIYANDPLKYEPQYPRNSQMNNRMAVEFGFPNELFPGKELNGSQTEIDNYIKKLDEEFKFIIISEQFDESMILMKRVLNWHTKNVLYVSQNAYGILRNQRKILPEKDYDKIRNFLYLDVALYDFALKRFNKQVEEGGEDFLEEVKDFKSVLEKVTTFCKRSKARFILLTASKWYGSFTVSKDDCRKFYMHEKDLIKRQRVRMYGVEEN